MNLRRSSTLGILTTALAASLQACAGDHSQHDTDGAMMLDGGFLDDGGSLGDGQVSVSVCDGMSHEFKTLTSTETIHVDGVWFYLAMDNTIRFNKDTGDNRVIHLVSVIVNDTLPHGTMPYTMGSFSNGSYTIGATKTGNFSPTDPVFSLLSQSVAMKGWNPFYFNSASPTHTTFTATFCCYPGNLNPNLICP